MGLGRGRGKWLEEGGEGAKGPTERAIWNKRCMASE